MHLVTIDKTVFEIVGGGGGVASRASKAPTPGS